MAEFTVVIGNKNYSSWSLRGWLLCRMAGLDFTEKTVDIDEPGMRQELLLLSPSVRVPRLTHGDVAVWDTLAIAEYLNEISPEARLLPVAQRRVRGREAVADPRELRVRGTDGGEHRIRRRCRKATRLPPSA